jgi:hypothetical protein
VKLKREPHICSKYQIYCLTATQDFSHISAFCKKESNGNIGYNHFTGASKKRPRLENQCCLHSKGKSRATGPRVLFTSKNRLYRTGTNKGIEITRPVKICRNRQNGRSNPHFLDNVLQVSDAGALLILNCTYCNMLKRPVNSNQYQGSSIHLQLISSVAAVHNSRIAPHRNNFNSISKNR